MELRKESVQMLRIKSKATSQVTFDPDSFCSSFLYRLSARQNHWTIAA